MKSSQQLCVLILSSYYANFRVKCVHKVMHLFHLLNTNVYEFAMSKCIDDFNHQCNIFFVDFKYYSSHIRNVLFQRYCTRCYGTQMLSHFDTNIQDVYTTICLPMLVGSGQQLWFAK